MTLNNQGDSKYSSIVCSDMKLLKKSKSWLSLYSINFDTEKALFDIDCTPFDWNMVKFSLARSSLMSYFGTSNLAMHLVLLITLYGHVLRLQYMWFVGQQIVKYITTSSFNHLSGCCCMWKAIFAPRYLGAAAEVVLEQWFQNTVFYIL